MFILSSFVKIFILVFIILFLPQRAFAHENYVLTQQQINQGMRDNNIHVLDALNNLANVEIGLFVAAGTLVLIVIYFFFQKSKPGVILDENLKKLEPFGIPILRIVLGLSFIYSAFTNSYLGPEIPTSSLILGNVIHYSLYILGVLLILGLFNNLTGFLSLIIIILATLTYKDYMMTYFNYFGEFIALMFFGTRFIALDQFLPNLIGKITAGLKKFEAPIIRVTYGISILYPAISIKILHPIIIIQIVNQYHLNQIHWLFPQDPLLISLGTGLTQIAVGLFIIIGFETRMASLITFVLYLMSILYFKEVVWPHYILLALALYLVINNGGRYTIDSLFIKKWKKQ